MGGGGFKKITWFSEGTGAPKQKFNTNQKIKNQQIQFSFEKNPCSSSPCFNNGTCQAGYTSKGFRCKCPTGFTGAFCKEGKPKKKNRWVGGKYTLDNCFYFVSACSLDFEDGIGGWVKSGTAFDNQPTFGDNPKARKRESARQQGNWWIGGAELRPKESAPPGKQPPDADLPQGTLTSPCFQIVGHNISFLIGGGCEINEIRAELIVNHKVGTSNCIMRCNISLPVFFSLATPKCKANIQL